MTLTTDKVAFIHYAKAAGRYVGYYLRSQVFGNGMADQAEQEFKIFNSWEAPYTLGRDWTETELMQLANNRFPAQYPTPAQVVTHHRRWAHDYLSRQYVHNHHYSWTRDTVREFRHNGWLTFMFIREPAELLCSLWTWSRNAIAAGADPGQVIRPPRLIEQPLDAFIREILSTPAFHNFYALPDFVGDIDYVAELTQENFGQFLHERFNHRYHPDRVGPRHRYSSGNPGYVAYRHQGLITDETHAMINADVEVGRVREHLGTAEA